MHVLVLPSWFPTALAPSNGAYFYRQLHALRQAGHQVGVVYPEHHSMRRLSLRAITTHRFQTRWHLEYEMPVLRRHGWNLLSRAPGSYTTLIGSAVRLAERYAAAYGRPDIIHALSTQWAGGAAARLATQWSQPMALTEHFSGFLQATLFPEQRRWAHRAFARANAVAAVSPALRTALHTRNWCDASRIRLLPNPVDFSFFTPPDTRPDPPPVVWACVGKLVRTKGIDLLLRALVKVLDAGTPVHLHVVGDGPQWTPLRTLAEALGVQAQVTFHGHLSRTGVRTVLQEAHGYVLASRHETFGLPVVEALACGCAVVATRCGGPEYILSDTDGHLVAPNSVGALSRGLLHATRALGDGQRIGPSSVDREWLHNRFSYDTFVTNTTALYQTAKQHHT